MANEYHYPAGTPGGKGGQFRPKGNGGAISFIPETTSTGEKRVYYKDLTTEEQEKIEKEYVTKHSDVFSVNDYLYDTKNTSKINTDQRNFQRMSWVNDEYNEQLAKGPKRKDKRATLILGLPGSGKSTIANPLSKDMGAFIVDADEFKERIPEFKEDHKMVSAVHHESVKCADEFMNQLSDDGYNMLIGKVGGDYESIGYILDSLGSKGYKIDIVLNDVPFNTILDRVTGRFERGETDRLIPFWTIKTADKNVFNTFDKALKHKDVIGGKVYNNDVEKGTPPILLHEYNNKVK